VHEDEAPGKGVAVLDLAHEHLRQQDAEEHERETHHPGRLSPRTQERPPHEQQADPEHGRRAHVDVDGVADAEPEPVHVLVGPGMRAGGRGDGAGHDHRGAGDDPHERDDAQPARRNGRAEATGSAPRLEDDDDRERDDDEREEEVRHDGERVEVEDHREAPERDLRDGPEERGQRDPDDPARQPCHAARRVPGGERREDSEDGDHPVPELDHRVVAQRGERRRPAARPVVAAEARAGQPHEGARGDDEAKHDDGADREVEEAPRRHRIAQAPPKAHDSVTPAPSSTAPTWWSASPAAANVASSTTRLSLGNVTRRPPAVCGS
jgi:hypothetical protein